MHIAIEHEQEGIVSQLLLHGADPTQCNFDGMNAFHFASCTSKAMLQLLLSIENSRANDHIVDAINNQSVDGTTPLHMAIKNGKAECVEILLSAGAEATKKYKNRSPLTEAMVNEKGKR